MGGFFKELVFWSMYKASWGHLKDRYIHRKDTIFRVNSPAPNQINLCLQYIHAERPAIFQTLRRYIYSCGFIDTQILHLVAFTPTKWQTSTNRGEIYIYNRYIFANHCITAPSNYIQYLLTLIKFQQWRNLRLHAIHYINYQTSINSQLRYIKSIIKRYIILDLVVRNNSELVTFENSLLAWQTAQFLN